MRIEEQAFAFFRVVKSVLVKFSRSLRYYDIPFMVRRALLLIKKHRNHGFRQPAVHLHFDNSDKGVTPVNIIRFECLKQVNPICQGLVELTGGNFFRKYIGADKIIPRNC